MIQPPFHTSRLRCGGHPPGGRTSPPLPDRGHGESNEAASAFLTAEGTQTLELKGTLGSLLRGHENDERAVESEAALSVQLNGTLGLLLDGQKTNDSARGGGGADPNDAAGGRARLTVRGPARPDVAATRDVAAGARDGGNDEDPKGRRRPGRRPGSPHRGSYTNVDWHDVPQEEDDAIGRRILRGNEGRLGPQGPSPGGPGGRSAAQGGRADMGAGTGGRRGNR